MQTHLVFGAGLIGCFLGGAISSKGFPVTLVCREHIKKTLQSGIRLTDYQDNSVVSDTLSFSDKAAAPVTPDVLWLTVKCTGVGQACADMKGFIGPKTVIICCQNGLGSEQVVQQHFPNNTVLRAMVPFNVVEMAPGHYHRGSEGMLTVEATKPQHQWVEALVNNLSSAILPLASFDDMRALLWAKLQLNLGNSINALADIPVKSMLEQRKYRLVIAAMMKELLAVTAALDITLPKVTSLPAKALPVVLSLPNWFFLRIANKMLAIDPNVRTSMWWDLSQGKKTEIEFLNGAIIDAGKKIGLACPVNSKIVQLINQQEQSNDPKTRIRYTQDLLYNCVFNS